MFLENFTVNNKTALVTGSGKGIGKACADLLGQQHEIVGLSRSNGFDIQQTKIGFSF